MNKISRSDYEKLQQWLDNIEVMNIDKLIQFFNELKNKYDWCIHAESGKYDICNDDYQHSIDFTLQCKKENEYKYIDELYFASVYCDGSGAEDLAEMYSDVPLTTNFDDGFGGCFFQFRLCDYKYFLQQLIKHLEDFVKDGKIDRQAVYDKYDGHCAYCGCKLESIKDMQVDHILPQRNGGNNEIDNLNPSCRLCNHYKRGNDLETFRTFSLGGLIERLKKIYIFRVALKYGMIDIKNWDAKFYFETLKKN